MHTENSERGWNLEPESRETPQQRANRESSERFYKAKDASENRDLSYEERRKHEDIMREEFFRERPEPRRDYLNEF